MGEQTTADDENKDTEEAAPEGWTKLPSYTLRNCFGRRLAVRGWEHTEASVRVLVRKRHHPDKEWEVKHPYDGEDLTIQAATREGAIELAHEWMSDNPKPPANDIGDFLGNFP